MIYIIIAIVVLIVVILFCTVMLVIGSTSGADREINDEAQMKAIRELNEQRKIIHYGK